MQSTAFSFLGRRIELWTHPEPDHLAGVIRSTQSFYEPDVLLKCRELHIPGTTVVDVGANIGNHTVFFAGILGAAVHAFEPFEPNHALLDLNVAVNELGGLVRTHRVALGARSEFGTALASRPDNFGMVSVAPGAGDVAISSLDDHAFDDPIGLLKVDVEGAEMAVLQGSAATIARWLPDIVVEADGAKHFHDVAWLLHGLGYVPRGRYAWTPTYLFSAADQSTRMRRILDAREAAQHPPRVAA